MSKRPKVSPALVVAAIALIAAVGGTAVGNIAKGPGVTIEPFFDFVPVGTGTPTTIATVGTVKILGTCNAHGQPRIYSRITEKVNQMDHVENGELAMSVVPAGAVHAMSPVLGKGGMGHMRAAGYKKPPPPPPPPAPRVTTA
jgi:hypothetical protein